MRKIRIVGTCTILLIITIGFVTVSATAIAFVLKRKGVENDTIDWFSQNAEIDLSWVNDFHGDRSVYGIRKSLYDRTISVIDGVKGDIEEFATGAFPKCADIKPVADYYKENILQNNLHVVYGGDKSNDEYAAEAVYEVEQFADYLKDINIDFLYVHLPSDIRIKSFSLGNEYPYDELDISDRFSQKMKLTEVSFLNICDSENELRGFSLDASDHWFPKDGLIATKIMANKINELFDYSFDASKYELEGYYNALDLAPLKKSFIYDEFGYEYELWVPASNAQYYVDDCEEQQYRGDFAETLLTSIDQWDKRADNGVRNDIAVAYHNMWTIRNDAYVNIKNLSITNNEDKRIMVLGDSYSWPISSYISQDVKEVLALHPRYHRGKIKAIIDVYKPDLVIWIYQEGQIGANNGMNFACVE